MVEGLKWTGGVPVESAKSMPTSGSIWLRVWGSGLIPDYWYIGLRIENLGVWGLGLRISNLGVGGSRVRDLGFRAYAETTSRKCEAGPRRARI